MNTGVRWRLSAMMFLEYMIWGAWSPVLSAYLGEIGFTGVQSGWIYALLPLGCMIAPFAGGQLADRYVATEKLLAVLHLVGAVLLFVMATTTAYMSMATLMFLWALVYAPTLALTNSITFHHLPDAEKKFGLVRVFGTLGWIAAGLTLSGLRQVWPDGLPGLGGADSLWLAGLASVALGVFSFVLPHTPPAKAGTSPWAFLGALKLLRDPSFAIFIVIAFIVSTELMFYYVLTAPFLEAIGVESANVPAVMTIAQAAEIGTMLLLPWMLERWGVRKTMAVGILAWPIRYAIFAYGQPKGLVIAALTLHGICYVCFFVVCYIYVNSVASPDIRASAQAFITFVVLGVGMFLGSLFAGWIRDFFTSGPPDAPVVDYTGVFLVPCALTVVCAIVFLLAFRERKAVSGEGTPAEA
jgi:nucleoside transporter